MKSLLKTFLVTALFIAAAIGIYTIYRSEGSRLTATTRFSDVADLAVDAPVQLADVRIGRVSAIELNYEGDVSQAKVTLRIDHSAEVPADVEALLRRTSVLGEKVIELRPRDSSGTDQPLLEDGTDLGEGTVVSDLEQLVASGEELFAVVSASELASILQEGAIAFEGQGMTVRQTIDNFSTILTGYGSRTEQIAALITNLEDFSSTTGPAAQSHAESISNLAVTIENLESERTELIDLLDSLDDVAREGQAILQDHLDEIATALDALAATTDTIVRNQDSLALILQSLPGHNINLPAGVNDNFVQVLNDIVICGAPGGGEQDTPVYTCSNKFADPIPRQSEEPDAAG